ncbi:MAG: hypothetical protein ACK5AJ_08725 [bacterium]|jgi:hypothetical protein
MEERVAGSLGKSIFTLRMAVRFWQLAARSKIPARQFFAVDEQFLSRYFQIIGS